jgi:hypothetical protein
MYPARRAPVSEALHAARRAPLSEAVLEFTALMPRERGPILEFMVDAARTIPQRARVFDVGAGDAPYADLIARIPTT